MERMHGKAHLKGFILQETFRRASTSWEAGQSWRDAFRRFRFLLDLQGGNKGATM